MSISLITSASPGPIALPSRALTSHSQYHRQLLAGESSKLIAIQSIEDTLVEPDEAFSITLSSSDTTALFTDDTATTILNDDAPVTITNITTNTVNNNQTYLNYNSYSVDKSRNYNIRVGSSINTGGGSFVLGGDGNSVGNSTTTTTINADFKYTGTALLIAYWALKVPAGSPGHMTSLMPEQATTSAVVVVRM